MLLLIYTVVGINYLLLTQEEISALVCESPLRIKLVVTDHVCRWNHVM